MSNKCPVGGDYKFKPYIGFKPKKRKNVNHKKIICKKCKKQCKEQIYSSPTWFGKYVGTELMEVICVDCYNSGEKWEESSFKNNFIRE